MSFLINKFYSTQPQKLRIAVIGQSNFAAEVVESLLNDNHEIVGIFTIPDKGAKEDILAETGHKLKIPVFKIKSWRKDGVVLPDVFETYKSINANLNILPFCSQFIPMEIIDGASLGSICYHPSILPRHRGASSISWTLIEGDDLAGLSIFWADDGLDTGPILLQRQTAVDPNDTLDTLYKRFLYPEGVKAMVESVKLVANGTAPKIQQTENGATYDPALFKEANQVIDLNQTAQRIYNFIRGLDSVPGAITHVIVGEERKQVRLFGASLHTSSEIPQGESIVFEGLSEPGTVHTNGILLKGTDGKFVNIQRIKNGNRVIQAAKWYNQEKPDQNLLLELSETEKQLELDLNKIWHGILKLEIDNETDFFASGAGSMDVVRLIEEIKDNFNITMENEVLYLAPTFGEFMTEIIKTIRDGDSNDSKTVEFDGFVLKENKMEIRIPTQMFVNGKFKNAENNKTLPVVSPITEELLCNVACASSADVDEAVNAAEEVFYGQWSQITPRQRGKLMFKLADILEQHKEELATIESVDSGAVYTLALKTHIGMSIEAWRYFAGWTDKIEGSTVPVSAARPNNVLTFTKKEPIGVVGLITPWNYPMMMLSWKMAACIAAGNTVVIKPAQVCPLSALKFAEFSVLAGFPPGVINVLTGTGSRTGQAITDHPKVRKLGFTGSTPIGKHIMASCASNLKKCTLELGGKSPLVIFSDCDMEKAIRLGMSSVFFNKGENCIAAGRLFVDNKIHDEFVKRVVENIKTMKIGNPLDRSTAHGPQNHEAHLLKLIEYCDNGVKEGAKLVYGGKRVPNMKGYYFEPTVFTDVQDNMFIAKEESFGPIMVISKFDESDVEAIIKRANDSEYGLASGIFTKDISRALLFAEKIEAGTVFVNTYNKTDVAAPFGGFKQSGFGKDLGKEALNEYLKTKCVTIEF